ncbi:MAG: 4Fe-4S binding protein [Syntrophaceae bacterium]|nr:4Fe-4S binding protein [Syntrophaceae bacterium]
MSQPDVYRELSKKLIFENSPVMQKIWRMLCDEREANIVNLLPATTEELATKFGTTVKEMQTIMDRLFKRGVIIDSVKGGITTYRMPKHPLQLHDWTLSSPEISEELMELWREFGETDYPALLDLIHQIKIPAFMRVIPIGETILTKNQVLGTEDAVKILQSASTIAVTDCVCRKLAKKCDRPVDVCLQLNRAAEFVIKRGTGRKISFEEGVEILKRANDAGLVHLTENSANRVNMLCNCCDCCCELLRFAKDAKYRAIFNPSRYEASVNADACNMCNVCVDICPMDAIQADSGDFVVVDKNNCIGCGVCAHQCPTNAITLVEVRSADFIPA